jgi:hypothetical protein
MLTNKQKLDLVLTQYRRWLKSIGLKLNNKGRVISNHKGFDIPYATQLPAGKTIGIAYNKGAYQVVDSTDIKTMGRKV